MALFDSDFLKKLEYLSLVSKRTFRGQMLARRRTMQSGSGVEFSDHRQYVTGDDLRYVDWNVYARYGELLLKRFQEEQDLQVDLLVDCSLSMGFGNAAKFDLARQIAGALAYIALADWDRVSVTGFADGCLRSMPPTRGKDQILSVLRFLESMTIERSQATNLKNMARDFSRVNHRGDVTIVISDFFDPAGFEESLDRLRHAGVELHLMQLYDPTEANPSTLGDLELFDCETRRTLTCTVRRSTLAAYQRRFQRFLEALRSYATHYALNCVQATTEISYDQIILQMMRTAAMSG